MDFLGKHPVAVYYDVQDLAIKHSQTLVWIGFYWLIQTEYQNIMKLKCIKCKNPEFKRNHSTACIHCWEVVIDDEIATQSVKMISTERLNQASLEIGKLFNFPVRNLRCFCENTITNISPRELAHALNYKWSPIFTKLGRL